MNTILDGEKISVQIDLQKINTELMRRHWLLALNLHLLSS